MSIFQIVVSFFTLVGALGVFLYGMKLLSESLQKVAGKRMKHLLESMTSTRLKGILMGILVTVVIQSSSATTVMVVGFVNAGLLTLVQAVGVIMGANIGTTVTAWIISLFGFKMNLGLMALPLLGLGVPFLFSKPWLLSPLPRAYLSSRLGARPFALSESPREPCAIHPVGHLVGAPLCLGGYHPYRRCAVLFGDDGTHPAYVC